MSDPTIFMNSYANGIQGFINTLMTLQTMNLQLSSDPTLITRYFSGTNKRSDIVAADVSAAQAAIVQMLFTFNSGSPTQAAALFKMTQ